MITAGDKDITGSYFDDYSVTFVSEYMTITVGVWIDGNHGDSDVDDETKAIEQADSLISQYYGFSPNELSYDVSVEYCGAIS